MSGDHLFTPGSLDPDQLLDEFVGRKDLLERLLGIVGNNRRGHAQQHVLLIGPRGMGKTMALLALAYRIEGDPKLSREWMTLVLPEELYGVGDLADFWLIVAERLYAQSDRAPTAVDSLRRESPEDIAERALDLCLHEIDRRGRRLLLCIENLNDFFESVSADEEQHRLRAFLMEDDRVMLAGSATSYFGAVSEMERPFFDFFRSFVLRRFDSDEMFEVLRTLAQRRGDDSILAILEQEPQRIRSLHILTGGNPRLIKAIYRLLREGAFGDARRDLQRLMDDCTPYFKHRIESLAREQRRVFDRVAQSWDPVSAGDLERVLRRPSSQISTYLRRLVDEGYVEEGPGSTDKRKRYQVAERFYNIYYLMRFSRQGRRRLEWLTCYMQVVYSPEDYRSWVDRMLREIRATPDNVGRSERVQFLDALVSSAEDAPLRQELARKAAAASFEADQLRTLDDLLGRQAAREALGEEELSIIDVLAGLDEGEKAGIGYQPDDSRWWYRLTDFLENREMWSEAETAYHKAIDIDPGFASPWNGLGNLCQDHLGRFEDAEQAYRKAIDIDPKYAYPWNGLGVLYQDHLGRFEDAEQAYRKAIDIDPESASPWNGLGILYKRHLGRFGDAEEAYRKAIDIDPEYPLPWNGLGILYKRHLGRFGDAEEAYRKAIDIDPEFADPWNGLGNLYQDHLGRFDDAEEAYREAIDIDPESADPWNGLGNLYQEHLGRVGGAEEAYRKATEIDPEYAYPWAGLADCLHTQGKLPEARTSAIRAVALGASIAWPRRAFLRVCGEDASAWAEALPAVMKLELPEATPEVFEFVLRGAQLVLQSGQVSPAEMLAWIGAPESGGWLDEFALALRASAEPRILERVAPERRAVAQDLLAKLAQA